MASSRYGRAHTQLRDALLPMSYGRTCHFCGQVLRRGQALDLDHTEDGRGYRGMTHASCNRSAGARRAAQRRAQQATVHARKW